MIVAIANALLAAPFVLVHGSVRQVLAEQSGLIGFRFLVRIIVACGYVALVEWIQGQVRQEDVLGSETDGVVSGCRQRPRWDVSFLTERARSADGSLLTLVAVVSP